MFKTLGPRDDAKERWQCQHFRNKYRFAVVNKLMREKHGRLSTLQERFVILGHLKHSRNRYPVAKQNGNNK